MPHAGPRLDEARRSQTIPKCRNAAMMGSRLSNGQGTARCLPSRFGAARTGSPASSLQWAIQHVFGTNPCLALTQSWISRYLAISNHQGIDVGVA